MTDPIIALIAGAGLLLGLRALARPIVPAVVDDEIDRLDARIDDLDGRLDGKADERGTLAAIGRVKADLDARIDGLPTLDRVADHVRDSERCAARNLAAALRALADRVVADADFEATEADIESGRIAAVNFEEADLADLDAAIDEEISDADFEPDAEDVPGPTAARPCDCPDVLVGKAECDGGCTDPANRP